MLFLIFHIIFDFFRRICYGVHCVVYPCASDVRSLEIIPEAEKQANDEKRNHDPECKDEQQYQDGDRQPHDRLTVLFHNECIHIPFMDDLAQPTEKSFHVAAESRLFAASAAGLRLFFLILLFSLIAGYRYTA